VFFYVRNYKETMIQDSKNHLSPTGQLTISQ